MKLFRCDRCGNTETPKDGVDYIENWESVTISTAFHFDICAACSPTLFKLFEKAKANPNAGV